MAPSKCVLLAVLVAFATLQPSAAIRAKAKTAAAPAPGEALQPSIRPRFFIPPLFPCIPGLPRIPLLPCYQPKPLEEPTECWSPLMKMTPCAAFFTNTSVSPLGACCDGYQSVVDDSGICFCHVANGDISKLFPSPLNLTNVFALPHACGSSLRIQGFSNCYMKEVPPMTPPSPPPSAPAGN